MKFAIVLCLFGLAYAAEESNVAICHLEPERGMCLAYMPRYYYNAKEGKCERFIYGGCQGNPNNFKTLEECEAKCAVKSVNVPVCEQEPETGPCRAYLPRYYYDKDTGKCSRFVYGGCGGNQNNFETKEECLETCAARSDELPVCEQDAEPGLCKAYFPRYYYNKHTGECEKFIYGGCGGNKNNFKSKKECEENCQEVETESVCELEAETGNCLGYFPRYYFNEKSGKCEKFIYGGCGGNGNNFKTKQECEQQCPVSETESICELDAETGPCRAYFKRFFYNRESGECETFVYGGCQGNANNFETKEACEQQCAAY